MAATIRNYDVILAPHITEKSTNLSEMNKSVFKVALDASKDEIASAIEALYNVKVTKVNTIITKGKTKRFKGIMGVGSTSRRQSSPWLKARSSTSPTRCKEGLKQWH